MLRCGTCRRRPASQRSRALAAPFADLDPACPAADGKGMDERGGGAAGPEAVTLLASAHSLLRRDGQFVRPYRFWRWRSTRPYWSFLAYFALTLAALQLLLGGGRMPGYAALLGYVALAIEAVLPIPQIRQNQQQRSCRGFRLSVLANWLLGDVMKMVFFFFGTDAGSVPWAFKLCGLFQFVCDVYLGLQYWTYGSKPDAGVEKAAAAAAEATVGSLTSGGEAFRLA